MYEKQRTQNITDEEWAELAGDEACVPPGWFIKAMGDVGARYLDGDLRPLNYIVYWKMLRDEGCDENLIRTALDLSPMYSRSRFPNAGEVLAVADAVRRYGIEVTRKVLDGWANCRYEASQTASHPYPTPPWFAAMLQREAAETTAWRDHQAQG